MSTPTQRFSRLSLNEQEGQQRRPRRPIKAIDGMNSEERCWEAVDHWISFNHHELPTDAKYVRIIQRLCDEQQDHQQKERDSFTESGNRAFTFIAWACHVHPVEILALWREQKSMEERASNFTQKLASKLSEVLHHYEEGSQTTHGAFSQLQGIIAVAENDMANRRHASADDELTYFKSVLTTVISALSRVTRSTQSPGSKQEHQQAGAVGAAGDSLAEVVFIDPLEEDAEGFTLDVLERLLNEVEPHDLNYEERAQVRHEVIQIAQGLVAMNARDQYRRRFLKAVRAFVA